MGVWGRVLLLPRRPRPWSRECPAKPSARFENMSRRDGGRRGQMAPTVTFYIDVFLAKYWTSPLPVVVSPAGVRDGSWLALTSQPERRTTCSQEDGGQQQQQQVSSLTPHLRKSLRVDPRDALTLSLDATC
ncbi:hypothetical protein GWK47_013032 [Chionoecetes opilio]|uniref:Uncharacterized protein n=1 Tax=Chionoecetes opilio TaxID=41210 RepID=A0A8J4XVS4_CHIOP|nr:hypothetical protein GWK47_013032 [Chionoecetes opilio]